MELAEYLRVLRRRWRLILLAVLVCVAGSAAASVLETPTFTTTTRLLVSGASDGGPVDEIARRQLANQRAVAFAQIATTGPAVEAAVNAAGASTTPAVTATADGSSPVVSITATGTSAPDVAAVANAYQEVLPGTIDQLEGAVGGESVSLSTLEPAGVPARPSSPQPLRNLLVGLVLGLVLGLVAAFMREAIDARIRDSSEIERLTNVGVLGIVPREFANEALTAVTRPRSRRSEAYRQVRTNLEFSGPSGAPRSFIVTSAGPGDGKTTIATNLAVITSHTGKSVVIVDADLRKPRVHQVFRVPDQPGLSDVLVGRATLDQALQTLAGENLTILASGPHPASPSELLGSTVMAELLLELERRFDVVIVDTPPVLPVADALLLAVHCQGAIIVTRLGATKRTALRRTVEAVQKVQARVLGIVGNSAEQSEEKRYGYGASYGYGYLHDRPSSAGDVRPIEHLRPAGRREAADGEAPPWRQAPPTSSPEPGSLDQ